MLASSQKNVKHLPEEQSNIDSEETEMMQKFLSFFALSKTIKPGESAQ